ncbi:hypothetical protein HanRHA438_Chr04g0185121 [Helianthus annuus]|nr:hypothetical protein HanRHA438_Chr04g0185121 [Helianthus annuus]
MTQLPSNRLHESTFDHHTSTGVWRVASVSLHPYRILHRNCGNRSTPGQSALLDYFDYNHLHHLPIDLSYIGNSQVQTKKFFMDPTMVVYSSGYISTPYYYGGNDGITSDWA